jgi:hypothetical protein
MQRIGLLAKARYLKRVNQEDREKIASKVLRWSEIQLNSDIYYF